MRDKIIIMFQEMRNTPSICTNLASTNIYLLPTIPSIASTGLNRYTIGVKGLKLQLSLKYNESVEGNVCQEWID